MCQKFVIIFDTITIVVISITVTVTNTAQSMTIKEEDVRLSLCQFGDGLFAFWTKPLLEAVFPWCFLNDDYVFVVCMYGLLPNTQYFT